MSNIHEYMLITGDVVESFNSQINEKIKQGWQPIGSLSSVLMRDDRLGNTNIRYLQVLGKYVCEKTGSL
ncbi:DUF1737 domain-containing protein [Foetidibacter luteolus]|uniref:DUF1737 domain-containing protein n=1 Tax=Foetidibacter luteolus TaxID=2608880 RepID=UPI001A99A582|nr:DUF1737 domain-containing protein [Foetidibacter luteolus]